MSSSHQETASSHHRSSNTHLQRKPSMLSSSIFTDNRISLEFISFFFFFFLFNEVLTSLRLAHHLGPAPACACTGQGPGHASPLKCPPAQLEPPTSSRAQGGSPSTTGLSSLGINFLLMLINDVYDVVNQRHFRCPKLKTTGNVSNMSFV